jgi:hypothetical protein
VASIDSTGEIDIICQNLAEVRAGRQVKLVFHAWDDVTPPFKLKVWSPSGRLIVDRVLRELPTGEPQSAAPVSFGVHDGSYRITIEQVRGGSNGEAKLQV